MSNEHTTISIFSYKYIKIVCRNYKSIQNINTSYTSKGNCSSSIYSVHFVDYNVRNVYIWRDITSFGNVANVLFHLVLRQPKCFTIISLRRLI